MEEAVAEELWCVQANIIKERPYGPNGAETKIGTKLFRGGAKVFVIGLYYGIGENAVVIGHHRNSVSLICSVVRIEFLENFKLSKIYNPKVARMATERNKLRDGAYVPIRDKSDMQKLALDMVKNIEWRKNYAAENKKI